MVSVLAFDCAGDGCAAAVVTDGRVRARRSQPMERGQAAALVPMIAAVMAEAGLVFAALDLVAVTTGPGAFTGVRIGLAAARGLALARGLPLVGVTSFAATAASVPAALRPGRVLAVALDSKRDELFLQCFGPDGTALDPGAQRPPDAAAAFIPPGPVLIAGNAARSLQDLLGGRGEVVAAAAGPPDPVAVARVAMAGWRPGESPPPPRPLYLRAPDTTQPRLAVVTP